MDIETATRPRDSEGMPGGASAVATLMQTSHGKAGVAAAALDTVPDEAPEVISVAPAESENYSAETAPVEQPESALVIEPVVETAAASMPEPIFVADDRNGEITDTVRPPEVPPETKSDTENKPNLVTENDIPTPAVVVEIGPADPVPEPVATSPDIEPASTAEPVRRKRGRPPLGERAMTTTERTRKFRVVHGRTERRIQISAVIADGLADAAARRGVTLDVLLSLVVDELDRGWCRPKRRRAA